MSDAPGNTEKAVRLQVAIAHSGYCSRRKAEELITGGQVMVNGQLATQLGCKVWPGDRITVEGQLLRLESQKHYLALNKPAGYLCAMSDTYGRPLAVDLFKPHINERIYNIGRLDLASSGLILFTNDGDFAASVSHPSSCIIKEYKVVTDYPVPVVFAESFCKGIADAGEILKAEAVEMIGEKQLLIRLREGKNREIRRALAAFKLHARVLHRIAIGPLKIGKLASGQWRCLSSAELKALRSLFPVLNLEQTREQKAEETP